MLIADSISRILEHVGLRASTFYAGPLCGLHDFAADQGVGHLHVFRSGETRVLQKGQQDILVSEPTLLFYPAPLDHRLDIKDSMVADVLCATVRYSISMENAITQSFPSVIIIPFNALKRINLMLTTLFAEAEESNLGKQVMLDRLCDILLIQIARFVIEQKIVSSGILAGLAHPRLSKLLVELLENPGQNVAGADTQTGQQQEKSRLPCRSGEVRSNNNYSPQNSWRDALEEVADTVVGIAREAEDILQLEAQGGLCIGISPA